MAERLHNGRVTWFSGRGDRFGLRQSNPPAKRCQDRYHGNADDHWHVIFFSRRHLPWSRSQTLKDERIAFNVGCILSKMASAARALNPPDIQPKCQNKPGVIVVNCIATE